MEDIEIEQRLRDIYYNPSTGYQSVERLYQKALADGLKVSRKKVKDWLMSSDTYTRYKPVVKSRKFIKTMVFYLGEQLQMDLVDMLEKDGIKYFSTLSDKKAAVVERFNRTLKTSMWKYFYSEGTYRWIDVLQKLTDNYNNSKHSSILMKPEKVNKANESEVWTTLYGHFFGNLPLPKSKVGDTVRISKYKSIFTKGYEANFTEEIFKISKVIRGDPTVYVLDDLEGEPIIGKFYEEELSAVDKKDEIYKVEKILKRKKVKGKKMVLVKWLGYDKKHNSWIPESDIVQNIG